MNAATRLADLERRVGRIPGRFPRSVSQDYDLVTIDGGNIIATGTGYSLAGLGYQASSVATINASEVAATGFPAVSNAYQTGLAHGLLPSGVRVFIACIAVGQTDLTAPIILPQGAQIWCRRSVSVPKSGDPATTYQVYLPWRI